MPSNFVLRSLGISVIFGGIILSCVTPASGALAPPAKVPPGFIEKRRLELPPVSLRGYGRLGAKYFEYGNPAGTSDSSLLFVQCAAEDKAKIVLAKYLSDLGSLGGVTNEVVAVGKTKVSLLVKADAGVFAAVRQGNTVVVGTAATKDDLLNLLKAINLGSENGLDFQGGAVPAYMDKFDKSGFGIWCVNPLDTPSKQENYDVREKFEWAKKMGVGLQFDVLLNRGGGAEGVLDDGGKRWAVDLAAEMGIPVTLQFQGKPVPDWMANRFADEMQRKIPQYIGNWYGINGNNTFPGSPYGQISWASIAGKEQLLSDQYAAVKKYRDQANVLGYGEWHGEVCEGALAMFMDYGPFADSRYRDYLREKYGTPEAVDQRWSSGKGLIKAWSDVRMPEPAEFLGWSDKAVDLQGVWRLRPVENLQPEEKNNWFDPALNETSWRRLTAPGDDRQLGRSKWRVPTIFRRNITLTEEELTRLKANGKTYLYVWSLEGGTGNKVGAAVNGSRFPDVPIISLNGWSSFDVTEKLRAGDNQISLCLPWGELSYRVYLSPEAPVCYPNLGLEKNARWVDYRDFITYLREDGLRRSMESIRRSDPDRFIKMYAPHEITDVMKGLCEDYGGYFHDTGGMSVNWDDSLPSLMRSSGLPVSLEPGSPASDVPKFKSIFGHWMTEGLQAVDYFMDIGNILWKPDQKAWFEAHQPLVHLLGKYHSPTAEIAVLEGARSQRLTGFPWDSINTPLLWEWRRRGLDSLNRIPGARDAVTESDFARGNTDKYRVIVDDGTLVMDEDLINKIEAWVREGGTFVAQGHTGRHSPLVPNSWPINRLTGYRVKGFDDNGRVTTIPGQTVFTNPYWTKPDERGRPLPIGAGVLLEKVSPDCENVLTWEGRGIAMGVRPMGKGRVVTLGCVMPNVGNGWEELFNHLGVSQPAPVSAPGCRVATFVSNNGLYDVYIVWANKLTGSDPVTLTVPGTRTELLDVMTGARITGTVEGKKVRFSGLNLEAGETYAYLAPRAGATSLEWLNLQREWWKGTKAPAPAPKVSAPKNSLDLSGDWAFSPITDSTADAMKVPSVDDSQWDRMQLGIWYGKKYPNTKKGIFRKRFTVPAGWSGNGQTWLWLMSSERPTSPAPFKTRIFLDGKQVYDSGGWVYGKCVRNITASLTPGEHLLAVSTESSTPVGGVSGNLWLEHIPEPVSRQNLAGAWGTQELPGVAFGNKGELARNIVVSDEGQGKRVVLYVELNKNNITGINLNGRAINRDISGEHFLMDLTPYLRPGQPNKLTIYPRYYEHEIDVKTVELRFYEPNTL